MPGIPVKVRNLSTGQVVLPQTNTQGVYAAEFNAAADLNNTILIQAKSSTTGHYGGIAQTISPDGNDSADFSLVYSAVGGSGAIYPAGDADKDGKVGSDDLRDAYTMYRHPAETFFNALIASDSDISGDVSAGEMDTVADNADAMLIGRMQVSTGVAVNLYEIVMDPVHQTWNKLQVGSNTANSKGIFAFSNAEISRQLPATFIVEPSNFNPAQGKNPAVVVLRPGMWTPGSFSY